MLSSCGGRNLKQYGSRLLNSDRPVDPYWTLPSGLETFVKCCTAATQSQGRPELLNVTGKIQEFLRITKPQTFFEIFDDDAAAVSSYR